MCVDLRPRTKFGTVRAVPNQTGFRCFRCGKTTPLPKGREAVYVCACGGNLEVTYDFDAAKRELTREKLAADPDRSVWRYFPLLPVQSRTHSARLGIGDTPLLAAPALGAQLGLDRLWLKDDTRHPSASFKDRAGAIALAVAHERGEARVAGASTGNAASSLACLAARTGMKTTIFVPHTAPPAKVAQILLFGATVVAVKGNYDQAFDLCLEACREYGWYNRNTGFNPYTREGKKTVSFEVLEQLKWQVPDWVVVPVGDGNIISGVWKGFVEARAIGLVDRVPKLLAAQAAGSNAVTLAVNGDGVVRPVSGATLADSISVLLPRDGEAAVKAVRESHGAAVAVSDEEILAALRTLASSEGVFAEPAAATGIACLKQAAKQGPIGRGESVVALVTGSGLKDVPSAMKAAPSPLSCEPNLDALKQLFSEKKP